MVDQQKMLPVLELEGGHLHALPGTHRQVHVKTKEGIQALREAGASHNDRLLTYARTKDFEPADPLGVPGCMVRLVQNTRLAKDDHMVIFTGLVRCRMRFAGPGDLGHASFKRIEDTGMPKEAARLAVKRSIMSHVARLERSGSSNLSNEIVRNLRGMDDLSRYIDFLALNIVTAEDGEFCHQIVSESNVEKRAQLAISHLWRKIEEGKIERNLRRRVKKQMERSHQEFHLSEQAKAIHEELEGESKGTIEDLRDKIKDSGMPEAAKEKCETEIDRLGMISPVSPEHSVLRTYVETLADLPWDKRTKVELDIKRAKKTLDRDHHGLVKVKDRIMEYLAVQRRVGKPSGSVMCFVGPPGVGKTSIGKSIARATGRKFARISLGGVHEEAAIRGHRRTYVASMPGRIIKAMAKAGVKNPVFMLDEFDKMTTGYNFHGDPASALLEVLDPEQNSTFVDQYLEVEFDLSEVLFITTANTVDHLPDALHDRLEIIRLPGYTDEEKIKIAARHLVDKQVESHGLKKGDVLFPESVIKEIVVDYTHEAGVRELERNIAKICRKVATEKVVTKASTPSKITKARVGELLEVPNHYATFSPPGRDRIGYANGLIYGRGLYPMETVIYKTGTERIEITGMPKGSDEITVLVEVAITLMKSRHARLGLQKDFAKSHAVHVHLQHQANEPFGALGLSMYALLASAFTKIPVRSSTAMLGEVNLRGDVISSEYYSELKATVMDAQRNRIRRIVLPKEDARLIADLPKELRRDIEFFLVKDVEQALEHVLTRKPVPSGKQEIIKSTNPKAKKRSPSRPMVAH